MIYCQSIANLSRATQYSTRYRDELWSMTSSRSQTARTVSLSSFFFLMRFSSFPTRIPSPHNHHRPTFFLRANPSIMRFYSHTKSSVPRPAILAYASRASLYPGTLQFFRKKQNNSNVLLCSACESSPALFALPRHRHPCRCLLASSFQSKRNINSKGE